MPPSPLRLHAATAVLAAVLLGACGGDEGTTTTVVRTVTVPAPPPAPTASTPAGTETAPAGDRPAGGEPAVEGTFLLEVYESNSGPLFGEEFRWTTTTDCAGGGACTVRLRRALPSGGFKSYVLRPDGERRWAAQAKATGDCDGDDTVAPARERVSLRVTAVEQAPAGPTARALEGYVVSRFRCDTGPDRDFQALRGGLEGG